MRFKTSISILSIGCFIAFSCNKADKNNLFNPVSPNEINDSLLNPLASFSANPAGGSIPIDISLKNSSSVFAKTFEWFIKHQGKDSLVSTEVNPILHYLNPTTDSIFLVAKNKFGISDTSNIQIVNITGPKPYMWRMFLDSLDFTNPLTMQFWNGSNGADVFFEIWNKGNLVSQASNQYTSLSWGWYGVPNIGATFPNISLIPPLSPGTKKWQYPSTAVPYYFPEAAGLHTFKFYQTPNILIGTIDLNLADYVNTKPADVFAYSSDKKIKIHLQMRY